MRVLQLLEEKTNEKRTGVSFCYNFYPGMWGFRSEVI